MSGYDLGKFMGKSKPLPLLIRYSNFPFPACHLFAQWAFKDVHKWMTMMDFKTEELRTLFLGFWVCLFFSPCGWILRHAHFRQISLLSKSTSSLSAVHPLPGNRNTMWILSPLESHTFFFSLKQDGKLPFLTITVGLCLG